MTLQKLGFRGRWWILPIAVLLVGLLTWQLQDVHDRAQVVLANLVAASADLRRTADVSEFALTQIQTAQERLAIVVLWLARLSALAGCGVVSLSLLGVRYPDLPLWMQLLTIGYALYCGAWRVMLSALS